MLRIIIIFFHFKVSVNCISLNSTKIKLQLNKNGKKKSRTENYCHSMYILTQPKHHLVSKHFQVAYENTNLEVIIQLILVLHLHEGKIKRRR